MQTKAQKYMLTYLTTNGWVQDQESQDWFSPCDTYYVQVEDGGINYGFVDNSLIFHISWDLLNQVSKSSDLRKFLKEFTLLFSKQGLQFGDTNPLLQINLLSNLQF